MLDIKRRMIEAREAAKLSQDAVGEAYEPVKSRQAIQAWESPKRSTMPTIEDLFIFAELCKTSYVWILTGVGDNFSGTDNLRSREVPLITFARAGSLTEPEQIMQDEHDEYFPCLVPHSKYTYALQVEGDSMITDNPKSTSYPHGTFICCDPIPIDDVVSGTPVIAYLPETDSTTFKLHFSDAGRRWLSPLNKKYDDIHAPYEIRSVVNSYGGIPK